MISNAPWFDLRHTYETVPNLLVKFASSMEGYELILTDLTDVWVESLSAHQIANRAEDSGCSISPGEDADQLRILLSKIETALACGEGTSVDFESRQGSDDFRLVLSSPLPKPLAPFIWHVSLKRGDRQQLMAAIVSPLLTLAYQQQKEMQHRFEQLQHKDHVIGKLLDRMESANVHLDSVFLLPNVKLTKKKSQREQFAKHVPGLATFQLNHDHGPELSALSSDKLCSMLGKAPSNATGEVLPTSRDGWWQHIENASHSYLRPKNETSMDLDDDETDDENYQQVQKTPDHVRTVVQNSPFSSPRSKFGAVPIQSREIDDEADTTDEGEDLPASLNVRQSKRPANPPELGLNDIHHQPRRLGTIGGNRAKSVTGTLGRSDVPNSSSLVTTAESEDVNRHDITATTPSGDSAPPVKPSPTKRRIGVIGGRSSQPSSKMSREESPSLPPKTERRGPGLHTLHTTEIDREQDGTSGTNRSIQEKSDSGHGTSSRTRDISEDRANRKREELKAQLQAKAPIRKKRRF